MSSFSVASHTAWAPGLNTAAAWLQWAHGRAAMDASATDPKVAKMPPMLRRRASATGKMALEAAYGCLSEQHTSSELPVIFASRHGECARSVELLQELAQHAPLSPTSFSLSVHNANGGLWSIARGDRSNNIAIAAGSSTVEHALIEACGLLADGAGQVLLVMADNPPPEVFSVYADCAEQGFAWAWLLQAHTNTETSPGERLSLSWTAADAGVSPSSPPQDDATAPGGLDILRFFLRGDTELTRVAGGRRWRWSRHA
jgi:hypothetical protein